MSENNKKVIVLTVGVSGAGKSTMAEAEYPEALVVSNDDYEGLYDKGRIDFKKLKLAVRAARERVEKHEGDFFVVANTNLSPKTVASWLQPLLKKMGEYEIQVVLPNKCHGLMYYQPEGAEFETKEDVENWLAQRAVSEEAIHRFDDEGVYRKNMLEAFWRYLPFWQSMTKVEGLTLVKLMKKLQEQAQSKPKPKELTDEEYHAKQEADAKKFGAGLDVKEIALEEPVEVDGKLEFKSFGGSGGVLKIKLDHPEQVISQLPEGVPSDGITGVTVVFCPKGDAKKKAEIDQLLAEMSDKKLRLRFNGPVRQVSDGDNGLAVLGGVELVDTDFDGFKYAGRQQRYFHLTLQAKGKYKPVQAGLLNAVSL